MRTCVLDPERTCMECGRCDVCDLDETKICDNCCRCLGDSDYNGVEVTEIIVPGEVRMKRKRKKDK